MTIHGAIKRLCAGVIAAACACGHVEMAPREPAFSLIVYGERVGVIYDYDALVAAIATHPPAPIVFELRPDDVEQFVVGPSPSGRYDFVLTDAAARRWHAASSAIEETAPFEVKLGDRSLFVGVFYTPIGAAAMRTPVLHSGAIGDKPDRVMLTVAAQLTFGGEWYTDAGARRIDNGDLRAYFQRLGVARTLDTLPPLAGISNRE